MLQRFRKRSRKGKMGTKGDHTGNHLKQPLDCAGKAQRQRRFSQKPTTSHPSRTSSPTFLPYKSWIYNTSRALSRLVVGGGGRPRLSSVRPRLPTATTP